MSQRFNIDSTTGVLTPNDSGEITINYTELEQNSESKSTQKQPSGPIGYPTGDPIVWPSVSTFTTIDGTIITIDIVGELTGEKWYYDVSLNNVISVKIGTNVTSIRYTTFFGANNLASIYIPSSINVIETSMFSPDYLPNLSEIIIDENSHSYNSVDGVLFDKSGSTLLLYPTKKTGSEFIIPSTVIIIAPYAFYENPNLTQITIPSSVTDIQEGAFLDMNVLTSIIIDDNNYYSVVDNVLFNKNQTTLILYPIGKEQLTYTIPNNVDTIQYVAFSYSKFVSVNMPSTIRNIGKGAFQYSNLKQISIPEGVIMIDDFTFYNASKLTQVNISASVTSINQYAFLNTIELNKVIFAPGSNLTSIGDYAFGVTTKLIEMTFPINLRNIGDDVFVGSGLTTVYTYNSTFDNIMNNTSFFGYFTPQSQENVYIIAGFFGKQESELVTIYIISDQDLESATPPTPPLVPICFPAGTPVTTNQGNIAIEKLNPNIHTINNKRIVAITQTRTIHNYIISIEKDALGKNIPCATTQISKNHKVFYKGKMIKANDLLTLCKGISKIPYKGETLYNVLMDQHETMMINNLICETLHPENVMAKICGGKYNTNEQNKLCNKLSQIITTRNVLRPRKLYISYT